jgi:RimJ/RimL family protein N-acetyltransferase
MDNDPTLAAGPDAYRWVPIRSLAAHHRDRILTHLLALETQDRYLRFGYAANDAQIERYVAQLNFERDEIFGIFNRRLDLIAMAHLAYLAETEAAPHMVEFGVSVLARARGRGFGARLFDRAVLHARNRNVHAMVIHALSENTAMLRIVRKAGASVIRDGGESEAHLELPPETVASHIEAMVEDHAAEFDYRLKRNAQQMDKFMSIFSAAGSGAAKVARAGEPPRSEHSEPKR